MISGIQTSNSNTGLDWLANPSFAPTDTLNNQVCTNRNKHHEESLKVAGKSESLRNTQSSDCLEHLRTDIIEHDDIVDLTSNESEIAESKRGKQTSGKRKHKDKHRKKSLHKKHKHSDKHAYR